MLYHIYSRTDGALLGCAEYSAAPICSARYLAVRLLQWSAPLRLVERARSFDPYNSAYNFVTRV